MSILGFWLVVASEYVLWFLCVRHRSQTFDHGRMFWLSCAGVLAIMTIVAYIFLLVLPPWKVAILFVSIPTLALAMNSLNRWAFPARHAEEAQQQELAELRRLMKKYPYAYYPASPQAHTQSRE